MSIIPRSTGLVDLCIRRPTLAVVINLLIVIAGLVALTSVDVREMPAVDQPVLSVSTSWSGASPEAVETQVTRVLEDALSRLEGLKTMSSRSSYGNSRITLEMRTNADIELSANSAREIVSQTIRQLPENVDEPRILRNDSDADPIVRMAVSGDLSIPELSVIAEDVIAERLALIDGVAEVVVTGTQRQQFRIEADMVSLMARGLSMDDVAGALRTFDAQTPLGSLDIGGDTIALRSAAPEISAGAIGNMRIDRATRVSDVAFVSLASEERRSSAYVDGRLSVGVDVVRDSLGNTLSVSQDVRAAVEELGEALPSGVSVVITSDDGVFIEQSIGEVVSSIIMATMIVVLTIYAFLGSVRATIIPAIAIPVALVGSIATVWLAGFSINTITLLALVLATGLVVDDAIVVVENIVRKRREGMGPRAAALSGAGEVFFAVVSTTITLAAVFIPVSFLPGQAGSIFSEFGFVLAFCVALSSVVALVLAPVIAVMVDPGRFETREEAAQDAADSRMGKMFDWTVDRMIRSPFMILAASLSLVIIAFGIARDIPSEVTPPEDRGFFVIVARASAGDGVETMDAAIADMEGIISGYRDAGLINTVQSFSGRGGGSSAFVIVRLTDWSGRNASQQDVMAHLGQDLAGIEGITTFMRASNSLGIRGGSGGLSFAIAARDRSVIDASADLLLNAMAQDPHFMNPQLTGVALQPALEVDLDHDIAQDLGLDETALNTTLNAMLEGQTVASVFLDGEEIDIVLVPGGGGIQDTGDLERVFLRARDGSYIPLSSVASLSQVASAATLERQDRWPSVSARTNLGAGVGTGVALTRLEELSREVLPAGSRLVLLGEAAAINEATQGFMIVFAVAFLIVLLVLAAQFESVTSALSIMITVPFGIAAAFIALWLTGSTLNYYSQIGLVLLVGVMAKNGILIVEFANQLRARGQGIDDAIRGAMRLRIRPVMMTLVSTVLGGLPLILSSGAGAEARAAVGWVIVAGLGFATIFTLTLTPAFYRLFSRFAATPGGAAAALDRELDALAAAQADTAR